MNGKKCVFTIYGSLDYQTVFAEAEITARETGEFTAKCNEPSYRRMSRMVTGDRWVIFEATPTENSLNIVAYYKDEKEEINNATETDTI